MRVPFVASWPGKIAPGGTSGLLAYFPDLLPTIAEVADVKPPKDTDGLSLVPTLIGDKAAGRPQPKHDFLYWEIGGWTAIRSDNWRAVKPNNGKTWEFYDLSKDPSESKDVAAANPDGCPEETDDAGRRLSRLSSRRHLHGYGPPPTRPPVEVWEAVRDGWILLSPSPAADLRAGRHGVCRGPVTRVESSRSYPVPDRAASCDVERSWNGLIHGKYGT